MTATGQSASAGRPRVWSFLAGRAIDGPKKRWLIAGLVVVLVGGAIGGWLGLRSTAHFVATRPLSGAFAKDDWTAAGGHPQSSLGEYAGLKFIPSAPFQIFTGITNDAPRPLTLTHVRVVFPHDSVIRQLGAAYEAGPPCDPGGGACGPREAGRNGTLGPSPLQVAPGKSAIVQLNFRFLGCPRASHASLQDVSRIDVTYQDPAGTIIHQRLGLATSTLKIVPSHPCAR